MYVTAETGNDHNKDSLDAVSMGIDKKGKAVATNRNLLRQFQNLMLPNLQEATFKADKIKLSDLEATGVEVTCKFYNPIPQVVEHQKAKKEETVWGKLRLFIIQEYIAALFQIIMMNFPQIAYLIFSLALVV
jgi:hypothetical protein